MYIRCAIAVFFVGLLSLNLQAQNSVTLNVNLYPIQTLMVNPSQQEVNLNYITKDDYKNGVVSEQTDHLAIYSTSGYQVKVSGIKEVSSEIIPLNSIKISASSNIHQPNVIYSERNVSEKEQVIIASNKGCINQKFNIAYKGAGENVYINYSKPAATANYHYNILYTIVSQ
ncbi:hypothetical protein NU10_12030 [Flavobacterium dauae]|uniref:hypothetical protein n=1 Tax=Flavobacterium dauae TaxID=1563479 RepID=UPI00101B4FE7|nr:hypothetical protein [Flavobacterium dauae]WLD23429.1 hypothetical protein NU10_12030 [Flavobacterium dauae]